MLQDGLTKTVVRAVMSGMVYTKDTLLSRYLNGPFRRHITVNENVKSFFLPLNVIYF